MTEIWKPSPVFGLHYEVSSLGRVRSKRGVKAQHTDKDGYPTVNLHLAGTRVACNVHRLVCRAFHGEPTVLHTQVAHRDGSRTNCRAENLRWVSKAENEHDKRRHGTSLQGERHHKALLVAEEVVEIKAALKLNAGHSFLARHYGVSSSAIRDIARGKNWRHIGSVHDGPVPKGCAQTPPSNPNEDGL